MARGRQQKWICKDCKTEFSIQGSTPKFCCSCGSEHIGRAPSIELLERFEKEREELCAVCDRLNLAYTQYASLKDKYDGMMEYWRQQRRRGFITPEEYRELAELFDGAKKPAEGP